MVQMMLAVRDDVQPSDRETAEMRVVLKCWSEEQVTLRLFVHEKTVDFDGSLNATGLSLI